MKKGKILLALAVLGAIGTMSAVTAPKADAAYPSFLEKLADRFNLNKNEVDTVWQEHRAERRAERRGGMETRLQSLVDDGKLTAAQKDELMKKLDALRAEGEKEEWRDKSFEERRELRDSHREEMQKLLSEYGIAEELPMGLGGGCRGGQGRGMNRAR